MCDSPLAGAWSRLSPGLWRSGGLGCTRVAVSRSEVRGADGDGRFRAWGARRGCVAAAGARIVWHPRALALCSAAGGCRPSYALGRSPSRPPSMWAGGEYARFALPSFCLGRRPDLIWAVCGRPLQAPVDGRDCFVSNWRCGYCAATDPVARPGAVWRTILRPRALQLQSCAIPSPAFSWTTVSQSARRGLAKP